MSTCLMNTYLLVLAGVVLGELVFGATGGGGPRAGPELEPEPDCATANESGGGCGFAAVATTAVAVAGVCLGWGAGEPLRGLGTGGTPPCSTCSGGGRLSPQARTNMCTDIHLQKRMMKLQLQSPVASNINTKVSTTISTDVNTD